MPKLKQRIFVACEGDGERALAITLQKFADENRLPVHLDVFPAKGGAPIDILRRSIAEMTRKSGLRGPHQRGAFVLLDQDRIDQENCLRQITIEARRKKIVLVRQQHNLECLLGQLLSDQFDLGPHRSIGELRRRWPDYQKGFDALALKSKLSVEHIRHSAAVGGDWRELLKRMGFVS